MRKRLSDLRIIASIKSVINSPSNFLLFFGMIIGLFFVITSPPGFGLDERAHFIRTYLISSGQFLPQKLPVSNDVGAYIPLNLVQFVGASTKDILDNNMSRFFVNRQDADFNVYKPFFSQPFSKEKVEDHSTNNQLLAAQAYSPFGYLHMAVATKIVRLLDAPMIYAMYFSRLVNLALYLLLIYWAIKIIPRYKWLLVCIGLLPTAIFQASSMSLDPFVTGLSIIATAYAVKFWLGKRRNITNAQVLIVAGVFVGIALIKTPYICLLLLFLGLPANRFASKSTAYIVKGIWFVATLLISLGWVYLNRSITPSLVLLQPGHADMAEQIRFIISKPVEVIGIIIKTHYESIDHTLASLIGRAGDRQVGLPNAFLYTLFVLGTGLTGLLYGRSPKDLISKKENTRFGVMLALTTIFAVFLISITLYVTFTPVGATTIQGIQGRYFLPILPVAMILIFRLANLNTNNKSRTLSIIRVSSLVLLVSTALIYFLVNF